VRSDLGAVGVCSTDTLYVVGGVNGVETSILDFLTDWWEGVSGESQISLLVPGDEAVESVPVGDNMKGFLGSKSGRQSEIIPFDGDLTVSEGKCIAELKSYKASSVLRVPTSPKALSVKVCGMLLGMLFGEALDSAMARETRVLPVEK